MADKFKREMFKRCGPGGLKCPCCNDFFGKDRQGLKRLARRGLKENTIREIYSELYLELDKEFTETDWKAFEYWEDWKYQRHEDFNGRT